MFSELIDSVANQYEKKLPFVIYRKPNEAIVYAIFQEDTQVHQVRDFTESGFVFAPFDTNSPAVLLMESKKIQATYKPTDFAAKKVNPYRTTHELKKGIHIDLVNKGIDNIQSGLFKKVVLSRSVEVDCTTAPLALFQRLLDVYFSAFCYLWYHPKIGMWMGATPEILLQVAHRQLTTMSLAGTQKYIENVVPEWKKKEIEEQQLVTDYISDALSTSVSNLVIGKRESVRAGNLWHLRTKITATLAKEKLANIVKALHPTPAVCGLPTKTAKTFILENETYSRGYYTGFLGEINCKEDKGRARSTRNIENRAYRTVKNTTTLFVNLRCMQLVENKALIYVGGGVTQDSDAEKEWEETVAKSNTMLRIIDTN